MLISYHSGTGATTTGRWKEKEWEHMDKKAEPKWSGKREGNTFQAPKEMNVLYTVRFGMGGCSLFKGGDVMRSIWLSLLLAGVLLATHCGQKRGKEDAGQYEAPRRPGESVLSWSDGYSSAVPSDCLDEGYEEWECSHFYLGKEEHRKGVAGRAVNLYDYVALLDFDYDPEPVSVAPGQPLVWTRLKVRKVIEEYVNRIPGKGWEEVVVNGICNEKGHCVMNEGRYPMPLWSGVSVVFGRVFCPFSEYYEVTVWLSEVYAVENDIIYDFYGFGYDWNEIREALKKAGEEAMRNRGEACEYEADRPASPSPEEAPASWDSPVPLPDP